MAAKAEEFHSPDLFIKQIEIYKHVSKMYQKWIPTPPSYVSPEYMTWIVASNVS